jgi:acetyltransferase
VLAAFGVPLLPEIEAADAAAAQRAAETLGYPIALKIDSPDILHKSDVNGVRLNVGSAGAVASVFEELVASVRRQRPRARIDGVTVEPMYRRADGRELHVGVARDSVFGPIVSFGLGGTALEVLRDRAVALPPLNSLIAQDLLERTHAGRLLAAFRHLPAANREAVVRTLLAVSEMACELPEIVELDINPLAADADGVIALDARLIIAAAPAPGRYAHMAIHPYPTDLVRPMRLADGTEIELRPMRPEDAEIEAAFVRDLSPRSRYLRFMGGLRELTPEMLVRFTQIDYDRELAMIAVTQRDGKELQIAVARYITNPDGESCEFAVAVDDRWQRHRIGAQLLALLIAGARARGLRSIEGEVLAENVGMLALAQRQGFRLVRSLESAQTIRVVLDL